MLYWMAGQTLRSARRRLKINWVWQVIQPNSQSTVVSLEVYDLDENVFLQLPTVFTMPLMPVTQDDFIKTDDGLTEQFERFTKLTASWKKRVDWTMVTTTSKLTYQGLCGKGIGRRTWSIWRTRLVFATSTSVPSDERKTPRSIRLFREV
jgi:hypothetical protein